MGLAVEVGVLAQRMLCKEKDTPRFRESLRKLNAVLAEEGLPPHCEPETLPELHDRTIIGSFPYSFLHYLRRAYAHWRKTPLVRIRPFSEKFQPADDPVVHHESRLFDSHLLCHSDCEGFYLPVDFSEILVDKTNQGRVEGGLLGSAFQLFRELIDMAPSIDVELHGEEISNRVVDSIRRDVSNESGLWIERCVWLTMFEAARLSILHRTAICFCES